jgi:hypothetical protein
MTLSKTYLLLPTAPRLALSLGMCPLLAGPSPQDMHRPEGSEFAGPDLPHPTTGGQGCCHFGAAEASCLRDFGPISLAVGPSPYLLQSVSGQQAFSKVVLTQG